MHKIYKKSHVDRLRYLKAKLNNIEARLKEMDDVYQHCLACNNTTDALHIRLQMAPLLVKKRAIRERIENTTHPKEGPMEHNYYINNNLQS
jgi:hypothetical protein